MNIRPAEKFGVSSNLCGINILKMAIIHIITFKYGHLVVH